MKNKPEFSTEKFFDRTLITKVTFDKPDLKKIVEARKRIIREGVYIPSEEYKKFKSRMENLVFPKEPCRGENMKKIDGFLTNLFKAQPKESGYYVRKRITKTN